MSPTLAPTMRTGLNLRLRLLLLWFWIPSGFVLFAGESAFLYRGELKAGGQPASGAYDLRFALADAVLDGDYLGPTLTNAAVAVSNGVFDVSLDFGAGVFDGSPRWLEIGVRTNGGSEAFVLLSPRQPILPIPYAVHAATAGVAADLAGGGAFLTALPASNLVGVIPAARLPLLTSNLVDSATDAAYRATDTNAVLGFARGSLMGPVVNVRDFGAVGDARTDDTAAVAAALDSASRKGITLYFPAGVFTVKTQLQVTFSWPRRQAFTTFSKFRILGDGSSATVIRFAATNGTLLTVSNVVLNLEGVTLQDAGLGRNNGITVTGQSGAHTLRDVAIEAFAGWGANFEGGAGGCIYSSGVYGCGIGYKLPGYCDGWTIDSRVDVCNVGIELGGPAEWPPYYKYDAANAARIHLVGSRNNYAVVVGKGAGADISGYLEACTNAFVAIGHPPEVYPTYQDSYVGTVELHNFAGLQFWGFTNAVKVFTKHHGLRVYNARSLGDTTVMVQVMNPEANTSSYTFEKVLAGSFIAFTDGKAIRNESWSSAGSAYVNPDPTRIYRGANLVSVWSPDGSANIGVNATPAGPNSLSVQGNIRFGGFAYGNGAGLTNVPLAAVNGLASALQSTGGPAPSNAIPVGVNIVNGIASIDALAGTHFRLALSRDVRIDNPADGSDGQRITLELVQDAVGSRTVVFGSKFAFGSDLSGTSLSTAPGKRDFVEAVYNQAADQWYVVNVRRGY
jgi:hypothetical protein